MKKLLSGCMLLLILLAVGVPAVAADLEAAGDHSVWVIVNDVKQMFEKDTGITLDLIPELAIVGKGCGKGILQARRGTPDHSFGLICCELDDAILKNYGLTLYPIAQEPLAIIVNKANPVNNLTLDQVRQIFSGKIDNWKPLGGRHVRIGVITQLHCADYTPNWKKILGSPDQFTKKRAEVKAQPEMAKSVADFTQAIGHLEMTSVKESKDEVKILSINGYQPTSENMAKGLYPLYAQLSVATKGEARGKVLTFIDYMRTNPKVKEAMEKYGMIQTK